jgi:hypothetical protein
VSELPRERRSALSKTGSIQKRKRAISPTLAEKLAIAGIIGMARIAGKVPDMDRITQAFGARRLSPAQIALVVQQITEEIPSWKPAMD